MALNNRDRIGKAMELLREGLIDVVDEVMTRVFGSDWNIAWAEGEREKFGGPLKKMEKHDVQTQLRALTEEGYQFRDFLSRAQQGWASELRDTRNAWAHGDPFSSDDTIRASRCFCEN